VLRDPPARGPVLAHDEQARDRSADPAALPGDLEGEARLAIRRHERRLHVGNHALDLDDEHDPLDRVEREDVDRAALAVDA
jgi:hypothetical protein